MEEERRSKIERAAAVQMLFAGVFNVKPHSSVQYLGFRGVRAYKCEEAKQRRGGLREGFVRLSVGMCRWLGLHKQCTNKEGYYKGLRLFCPKILVNAF